MTEPGYHGTTTVWKPCDENKCKKPATHGNFCNEHAPPHAVYKGPERTVTPRKASATLSGLEDGDENDDEDKGKKKSLCSRLLCRFKSKKTPKKSVKKAPVKSVKKASKKSVKKAPKKSVKKAPKKSVKKTAKKSHARRV